MNYLNRFVGALSMMVMVMVIYSCETDVGALNTKTEGRTVEGGNSGGGQNIFGTYDTRLLNNNEKRNELAQIIAISFCRKPVLKEAFKKVILDFKLTNNYYEDEMFFHLEKSKPSPLLNGKSIETVLVETVPEKPVQAVIDFLCQKDPGLAVLMEGNLAAAAIDNEFFIDEGFDDTDLNNEVYSYTCGTRTKRSIGYGSAHAATVFVLRESEAYSSKIIPQVEHKVFPATCGYDIIVIGSFVNGGATSDPVETRGDDCPNPWRDEEKGKENLYRYKTTKDFDPFRGKGEFLEYCLYGKDIKYKYNQSTGVLDVTGNTKEYVQKRQAEVRDNFQWREVNADLFRWDPKDNGYRYKLVWYEDDGGKDKLLIDKVTLSVKLKLPDGTTAEGSKEIDFDEAPDWLSDGDDFIGENIIDYCDPKGFDYTPSDLNQFVFNVNER